MNANAELDAALRRKASVALDHAVLHFDGTTHGVNYAAELDESAVACDETGSPDRVWMAKQAADYVDKIIHGTAPADLPVQQPDRYGISLNLKTAKVLGLDVPPTLLVRADEVIE